MCRTRTCSRRCSRRMIRRIRCRRIPRSRRTACNWQRIDRRCCTSPTNTFRTFRRIHSSRIVFHCRRGRSSCARRCRHRAGCWRRRGHWRREVRPMRRSAGAIRRRSFRSRRSLPCSRCLDRRPRASSSSRRPSSSRPSTSRAHRVRCRSSWTCRRRRRPKPPSSSLQPWLCCCMRTTSRQRRRSRRSSGVTKGEDASEYPCVRSTRDGRRFYRRSERIDVSLLQSRVGGPLRSPKVGDERYDDPRETHPRT